VILAAAGILDRNYRYTSVANQLPHNDDLVSTPYTGRKSSLTWDRNRDLSRPVVESKAERLKTAMQRGTGPVIIFLDINLKTIS
jgi:hypothetical protein